MKGRGKNQAVLAKEVVTEEGRALMLMISQALIADLTSPLGSSRYSSSELYKIVSDVNAYSSFLPFCAGSNVKGSAPPLEGDALATSDKVTNKPDKRVLADLTVGFKSFKETYTSVVEMKEDEWVAVSC